MPALIQDNELTVSIDSYDCGQTLSTNPDNYYVPSGFVGKIDDSKTNIVWNEGSVGDVGFEDGELFVSGATHEGYEYDFRLIRPDSDLGQQMLSFCGPQESTPSNN